jgi:hypothetical protein
MVNLHQLKEGPKRRKKIQLASNRSMIVSHDTI